MFIFLLYLPIWFFRLAAWDSILYNVCVCGVKQAPRAVLCSGAAVHPYSSHVKHTYRKFAVTAVAGARRHRRLRGVGTCPGTDVHHT